MRRSEQGQTLVINVVALMVMLGFAMLVIDGGSFMLVRRNMQGVADAAALAGVRSLPGSPGDAATQASAYVTTENPEDGASVEELVVSSDVPKVCNFDGQSRVLPPMSVCVTVTRTEPGVFLGLFKKSSPKIRASAIASAGQVKAVANWLPFGIQTDYLDLQNPTQVKITPGDQSDNVGGMVNICPLGTTGTCNGANLVKTIITGETAPQPVNVGDPINTQNGDVTSISKAFETRLNGNMDTFNDVFGKDASGNWYIKKPTSPRLAFMPIAEDTNGDWPLSSGGQMTLDGYVFAYIGRTTSPESVSSCGGGCPATTGSGSSKGNPLTVYLTPVNAPVPDNIDVTLGDYSAGNVSPVVFSMTS
jgi:hypothetical protein